MTRVLKAWGAGCAGELLLRLVLGVVIGGSVLCVVAGAALLPLSPDLEGYRPLMLGGGMAVVMGVAMAGVTVQARSWPLSLSCRPVGAFTSRDIRFTTRGGELYAGLPRRVVCLLRLFHLREHRDGRGLRDLRWVNHL